MNQVIEIGLFGMFQHHLRWSWEAELNAKKSQGGTVVVKNLRFKDKDLWSKNTYKDKDLSEEKDL